MPVLVQVPSECVDDRYDQLTSMTNYTDTCETLPRLMSRIGDACAARPQPSSPSLSLPPS